jgi:hypothetical protein
MSTLENANSENSFDENSIITIYMEDVLESEIEPKNVFTFCKKHSIEETTFYSYFGSFKALKQRIWVKFLENVTEIIENNNEFDHYSDKDKLLTYFFSLFEVFTLNRSYIVYTLEAESNTLKNCLQLKDFRKSFKKFIELKIESPIKNEKIATITTPVMSEGVWIQFLFILKFWLDDTSSNFEKTDILIEKSLTTSSLFLDSKPLESLFDLAKFLFKEKM